MESQQETINVYGQHQKGCIYVVMSMVKLQGLLGINIDI
jgi:hypothetical protein